MTSSDDLRSTIADLFEGIRSAVHAAGTREGVPMTQAIERTVVVRQDGSEWTSRVLTRDENMFPMWSPDALAGVASETLLGSILSVAGRIAEANSSTLPFWSPQFLRSPIPIPHPEAGQLTYEESPDAWAAERLVVPAAMAYLSSLPTVAERDNASLVAHVAQLLEVAGADCLRDRSVIAIAGVLTEADQLTSGPVTVGTLSDLEQGAILDQVHMVPPRTAVFHVAPTWTELPTHAIEVVTERPRMSNRSTADVLRAILCAFYLHGYELAGVPSTVTISEPRWREGGTRWTPTPLLHHMEESRVLTQSDLDQVCAIAQRLDAERLVAPGSSSELALHRFAMGCARSEFIDALLDFVIALEALLLPYDREARSGDLSYRFRAHGAAYLASDLNGRSKVWRDLQDLYNLRSRAVHGDAYPSRPEAKEAMLLARSYAATGLLRAIQNGFPDPPAFQTMLLS
jgi:hypothetical protein